jgi:hypothetical protein
MAYTNSRSQGCFRPAPSDRAKAAGAFDGLHTDDPRPSHGQDERAIDRAGTLIANIIGAFSPSLGIGTNVLLNGRAKHAILGRRDTAGVRR